MVSSLYSAQHSLAKASSEGVQEALHSCATALATLSRYLTYRGSTVKAAAMSSQLSHTVEQAARLMPRSSHKVLASSSSSTPLLQTGPNDTHTHLIDESTHTRPSPRTGGLNGTTLSSAEELAHTVSAVRQNDDESASASAYMAEVDVLRVRLEESTMQCELLRKALHDEREEGARHRCREDGPSTRVWSDGGNHTNHDGARVKANTNAGMMDASVGGDSRVVGYSNEAIQDGVLLREMRAQIAAMQDAVVDMQDRADASEETAVHYAKGLRRVRAQAAEREAMYATLQSEHERMREAVRLREKQDEEDRRMRQAQVQSLQQQLDKARIEQQTMQGMLQSRQKEALRQLEESHAQALAQVQSQHAEEMAKLRAAHASELRRVHELVFEAQARQDASVPQSSVTAAATQTDVAADAASAATATERAVVKEDEQTHISDAARAKDAHANNDDTGKENETATAASVSAASPRTHTPSPSLENTEVHIMQSLQKEMRALTHVLQHCRGVDYSHGPVDAAAAAVTDNSWPTPPSRVGDVRNQPSATTTTMSRGDAADSQARCAAVLLENRALSARMDAVMRTIRPCVSSSVLSLSSSSHTPRGQGTVKKEEHMRSLRRSPPSAQKTELLTNGRLAAHKHPDSKHPSHTHNDEDENEYEDGDVTGQPRGDAHGRLRVTALSALYQALLRARTETTAAALACSAAQRRLAAFTRLQNTMLDKLEQQPSRQIEAIHRPMYHQDEKEGTASSALSLVHASPYDSHRSGEGAHELVDGAGGRAASASAFLAPASSESRMPAHSHGSHRACEALQRQHEADWADVPLLDACAALFRYVAASFARCAATHAEEAHAHARRFDEVPRRHLIAAAVDTHTHAPPLLGRPHSPVSVSSRFGREPSKESVRPVEALLEHRGGVFAQTPERRSWAESRIHGVQPRFSYGKSS